MRKKGISYRFLYIFLIFNFHSSSNANFIFQLQILLITNKLRDTDEISMLLIPA